MPASKSSRAASGKAPGTRHRTPPPSLKGVKHSDTTIAKVIGAAQKRQKTPHS